MPIDFLGSFHPLLVHLPIGILFMLMAVEVLAWIPSLAHLREGRGVIVTLAALAAVGAAATGWMLAGSGGYNEELLRWHRWTGVAVAVGCVLMWVWHIRMQDVAYGLTFFLTLGLVAVAGHHGGSLTHGRDHLTRHAPAPIREWLGLKNVEAEAHAPVPPDPAHARVYADLVHPIFEANCLACHGAEKQKGGLRLDSLDAVMQGGKEGPVVIAGRSDESPLVTLMHLPVDHEDHMPPEGKPQPSAEDIELVQWWIETGAPSDLTVADLDVPASISRILNRRFNISVPQLEPRPLAEVLPIAQALDEELGIRILPVVDKAPWLRCVLSDGREDFGDEKLARLAVVAANLQQLDLGGSAVTDEGMALVGTMRNLTRLHLEKTGITDAGVSKLTRLEHLGYLNLYRTAVTDACLNDLQQLPALRNVFVWETGVTAEAAASFAERINAPKTARWKREMAELQDRMRSERLDVVSGLSKEAETAPLD